MKLRVKTLKVHHIHKFIILARNLKGWVRISMLNMILKVCKCHNVIEKVSSTCKNRY